MAFNDLELKRCENSRAKFLARRRPPPQLRDQVDIAYKIIDQCIQIVAIRADWKDATKKMEMPFAKATFVRSTNHWNVYWMRGNLKWCSYEPTREVMTLQAFLHIVDRDDHGCFFG